MSLDLALTDPDGKPVTQAHVSVEADMSHAGMSPVLAGAVETQPGRYRSALNLDMPGDWVVLLHGTTAEGRKFEEQFDVPGVLAK